MAQVARKAEHLHQCGEPGAFVILAAVYIYLNPLFSTFQAKPGFFIKHLLSAALTQLTAQVFIRLNNTTDSKGSEVLALCWGLAPGFVHKTPFVKGIHCCVAAV